MEKYPNDSNYYQSTSETMKNNKYVLKDCSGKVVNNGDDDDDFNTPIKVFPRIFPLLLTFRKSPRVSKLPLLPTIHEDEISVNTSRLPDMLDEYLKNFCMLSVSPRRRKSKKKQ